MEDIEYYCNEILMWNKSVHKLKFMENEKTLYSSYRATRS